MMKKKLDKEIQTGNAPEPLTQYDKGNCQIYYNTLKQPLYEKKKLNKNTKEALKKQMFYPISIVSKFEYYPHKHKNSLPVGYHLWKTTSESKNRCGKPNANLTCCCVNFTLIKKAIVSDLKGSMIVVLRCDREIASSVLKEGSKSRTDPLPQKYDPLSNESHDSVVLSFARLSEKIKLYLKNVFGDFDDLIYSVIFYVSYASLLSTACALYHS
ncbi:hypothetical protein GQR58_015230 [Nymphon striatum]|nr:hypothetical protein GQR58_015230 [Nymphon striatum]